MSKESPARFYDYTQIASLASRPVNTYLLPENQEIVESSLHKISRSLATDSSRDLVIHTNTELLNASKSFILRISRILDIAARKERLSKEIVSDLRKLLAKTDLEISSLNNTEKKLEIDISDLGDFFGLKMSAEDLLELADKEIERYIHYSKPKLRKGITDVPISSEELQRLSIIFSEFAGGSNSTTYLEDNLDGHYLFWTPEGDGRASCAIPKNYTLGDYLRFNSPHNDLHLAHLSKLGNDVLSYTDTMDVRAYFEAVAVFSEREFLDKCERNDSFIQVLYEALDDSRKKVVTFDDFRQWTSQMRGYEMRLRAVRLLGDLFTLEEKMSFYEAANYISEKYKLPHKDVVDEVRKYYEFPGLGAIYTKGADELGKSVSSAKDGIASNVGIISSWHQFKV